MATIQEVQRAAKQLKKRIESEVGLYQGRYKTTSSWSDVKYVVLTYNLLRTQDNSGNPGMFVQGYDSNVLRSVVNTVCKEYGIDKNHLGVHLSDTSVEIALYSSDSSHAE